MFLLNGISYIFSAFTELFIKVPKTVKPKKQVHFVEELKEGMFFVWNFKGLRYLLSIAGFINFFGNIALILWLPYFQQSENIGPVKYGIFMACLTMGMFLGMLFTTVINISPSKRLLIYVVGNIISSLCYASWILFNNFIIVLVLIFIGGLSNSIYNVFVTSTIQINVPQNMRGKVFGLMGTLFQGLTPIAMALGGILAGFISIKLINFVCYISSLLLIIPLVFNSSFRSFINFDLDKETTIL
ncbi:MAG: MFS transporter [Halanaerobiales bacterium]|nr:MFS transporter [Halanaerobiales bacterium]